MRQRSNLIILFGIAFFIVGGVLVFLVVNDDDDGGSGEISSGTGAQASILVAKADIAPNTLGSDVIEQGLLETRQVDQSAQPSGALTTASGLDNQIFALGVNEGDVITSTVLVPRSLTNIQVPEGFDGVAVQLDFTNGGAGFVAPGDTVNVYGVFGDQTTDGGLATSAGAGGELPVPRTELALTNVLVLGVSAQEQTAAQAAAASNDPNANRPSEGGPLTFLLALRPTDAERLVQLERFANIYLSLTADEAPPVGDTPGVSGDNVNGPVSADSAAPQS